MASYTHFKVDYPDNAIAVVTLTPAPGAKVFQFSRSALNELRDLIGELEAQPSRKVVVLTGAGKIFAAGADISEMRTMLDAAQPTEEGKAFSVLGQTVMDRIENSRLITIAAINGAALGGGCELGLACDCRIAASGAKLGQPEINLGLLPGWGGCRRLMRHIPLGYAKQLIFTGDIVTSETALTWGLVQKVVPPETLLDSALEMARTIAARSGTILRYCKEAVNAGVVASDTAAREAEHVRFGQCFQTADTREGIGAFLEKRTPAFTS